MVAAGSMVQHTRCPDSEEKKRSSVTSLRKTANSPKQIQPPRQATQEQQTQSEYPVPPFAGCQNMNRAALTRPAAGIAKDTSFGDEYNVNPNVVSCLNVMPPSIEYPTNIP